MPANGDVGYGIKLEYKIGSGSYTELADMVDLTPGEVKVNIAKYKTFRSRWQRQKAGTGEVGESKFKLVRTPTLMTTLQGLLFDETLTFKITYPDGSSTESFIGLLAGIGRETKVDDIVLVEVTLACDNNLTFA